MPDDPRFYMDYTGTGNSLNPVAPERAAADHGLAALLRRRLPRRRLPLRPRLGARARVPRGRPALGLLRHHPPGPGPLPGEADRRAVGRRRGRLPGRQLPDALDGVERHLPRRDARLLARPGARRATSRRASPARPTSTSRTAAGRSRRSTSSPRTTASRSPTSSRTTSKHNEANLEDNRDGTDDNRSWNCGVEGPTDDPAINALRERQQRNFLATLLPLAGRADAARRRRDRRARRAATTTRTARTTRSPGSTGSSTSEQQRLLEFTRRLIALRARASRSSGARRSSPARRAATELPDVWWFRPDGPQDDAARLGAAPARRALGVFLNGEELRDADAARRAGRRRLVPAPLQRAPRGRRRSRCRRGASGVAGRLELSTADPDAATASRLAARARASCTCRRRASLARCCGASV